jgi:hypothetical protein
LKRITHRFAPPDDLNVAQRRFKNGMVVWALVPDRNGITKPDPRPLLIISVHPKLKRGPFVAVAISTRADISPSDPVIEMPWDSATGGGIGLRKYCCAVLGWKPIVDPGDVLECTGEVQPDFLDRVLDALAAL